MKPDLNNPGETFTPRQARSEFLKSKKGEVKQSSYRAYRFPTKHFIEFCERNGIETVGEIGGYVIESWKSVREAEDIAQITFHNDVKKVRVFIRWCESAELIEYGTADRMDIPQVSREQAVSDDRLPTAQAEDTLEHLETYEYGSRLHALFKTMWHTGCRISGAMSLDIDDYNHYEGSHLKFRNRPSTGTPLKNGNHSERNVTIEDDLDRVLRDYIEGKRPNVTDEFDREPIFCTHAQRLTRARAYKDVTAITRPCVLRDVCPHDREINDCDAARVKKQAAGCPSSVSLHPVRRGSITYHINQGWPKEKLSERVDVSVEVLSKHYDARTKEKEREGRAEYLDLL